MRCQRLDIAGVRLSTIRERAPAREQLLEQTPEILANLKVDFRFAHMIPRMLQPEIERSLQTFPVVGLVGSRQVGKTTLAKAIAQGSAGTVYLDLERPSDLTKLDEPELYLEQYRDRLVILDEIQRKPDLFPLMRSLVDAEERNGRFLVLGSATPSLARQSSESLAGRIIYHELAPVGIREVCPEDSRSLWNRGGYPRSFLAASDSGSLSWREAFIQTYLERDLPQLGIRIPAVRLRRFWTMLAHCHAGLWNASKIARSLGVSVPTVNHYLDILHDTFIVRQLRPYHPNVGKRLVKSPKVYLRDSGILHSLLGIGDEDQLLGSPYAGASWEGWVIEQIAAAAPSNWQLFFYRTSGGAEIDLVILPPGGSPVAVEIKRTAAPQATRGFRSALGDLQCARGYVVYPGKERYVLMEGVEALPVTKLPETVQV